MIYRVIGWRPYQRPPLYFRGDSRYEVYLPYVDDDAVRRGRVRGWVKDVAYARVFDTVVVYSDRSFAKFFLKDRLGFYDYDGDLLPTQIFHPLRRPTRRRNQAPPG